MKALILPLVLSTAAYATHPRHSRKSDIQDIFLPTLTRSEAECAAVGEAARAYLRGQFEKAVVLQACENLPNATGELPELKTVWTVHLAVQGLGPISVYFNLPQVAKDYADETITWVPVSKMITAETFDAAKKAIRFGVKEVTVNEPVSVSSGGHENTFASLDECQDAAKKKKVGEGNGIGQPDTRTLTSAVNYGVDGAFRYCFSDAPNRYHVAAQDLRIIVRQNRR